MKIELSGQPCPLRSLPAVVRVVYRTDEFVDVMERTVKLVSKVTLVAAFALASVATPQASFGQEYPVDYSLEESQPNDFCRLVARYYLSSEWRSLQNILAVSPESRASCTASLLSNLDFIESNPKLLDEGYQIPIYIPKGGFSTATQGSRGQNRETKFAPNEQTCAGYGFKKGTTQFGQCLMQLDDAQRQAELQQQQYNLQLAQYKQQVAAYNAQQEEIRREKNRRQGEMLMRMSQGMLNSRSPSLLGGIADGLAAANGTPIPQPVPPPPPASQNYTIRMPNGTQVYCNYNSTLGYMSCR